ncbi:MAG: WD40 repeat domain-containing protein, partial [Okeania sp. SIO3B3]|nr:WD40 repeat domain-containing protein [Okeania sp. SIO3B3]
AESYALNDGSVATTFHRKQWMAQSNTLNNDNPFGTIVDAYKREGWTQGLPNNTIKVWNLETGAEVYTLTSHSNGVKAVAVNLDGKPGTLISNALVVTPDSKQVIFASDDHTIKVWSLKNMAEIYTFTGHRDSVRVIAVTPNGKQVISGSDDNTIKVWNIENGAKIHTLIGHTNKVNAVAVTPNGKQVISGSDDHSIKVWDIENGAEIYTLKGHRDSVRAIVVTPDGQQVISASSDHSIKVWNIENGAEIACFTGESSIECCAITPDGMTIVAGEASGNLHFLRVLLKCNGK